MDDRTAAILDVIKGLEPFTQRVQLRSPRGTSDREYTGVHFLDYARATGLIGKNTAGAGLFDHYFVVSATDGVRVTLGFPETAPRFTDKRVMLAYEQDGETINAGVRLIVPGDDLGGRSIVGVASVAVVDAGSAPRDDHPVSTTVELGGMVERPFTLDAAVYASLEEIDVTTEPTPRGGGIMVPPRSFRGVRLWDIIERASPVMDPAVNEDFLNKVLVVRSADGYATVIAGGEIEPRFMNADVILSAQDNGSFRLIVPYDKSIGRNAKNIARIELVATE
jgi:hypothetical protein